MTSTPDADQVPSALVQNLRSTVLPNTDGAAAPGAGQEDACQTQGIGTSQGEAKCSNLSTLTP